MGRDLLMFGIQLDLKENKIRPINIHGNLWHIVLGKSIWLHRLQLPQVVRQLAPPLPVHTPQLLAQGAWLAE